MRRGKGFEEDDRESILLTYHGETAKAWCVSDVGGEKFFLPQSEVDPQTTLPEIGKAGQFLVPRWLRVKYNLD